MSGLAAVLERLRSQKCKTVTYRGEIMGGGPSAQQQQAAASQTALNQQLGSAFGRQEQFSEAQQNKVNPFYTQMLQNGNPYFSAMTDQAAGTNAQAFAPARAQLEQQLGQNPNSLPSGFATQQRSDLAANQARSYDQTLGANLNNQFAAKQAGAAGLIGQAQVANPNAYASNATQGNNSVMNAPLAKPGMAGILGGLAGGLASAIPF
jgi:hypothetical protein